MSPRHEDGSGVASTVSQLSAPSSDLPHKLVLAIGPSKAFKESLETLRKLLESSGLTELIDICEDHRADGFACVSPEAPRLSTWPTGKATYFIVKASKGGISRVRIR